jgi:hypothetical protein
MYDGEITFPESVSFIIMYVVYLVVLIGGYFINRRIKDRRALLQAVQTESIQTLPQAAVPVDDVNSNIPDESYVQPDVTFALSLRHAFLPREDAPWAERGRCGKFLWIVKVR